MDRTTDLFKMNFSPEASPNHTRRQHSGSSGGFQSISHSEHQIRPASIPASPSQPQQGHQSEEHEIDYVLTRLSKDEQTLVAQWLADEKEKRHLAEDRLEAYRKEVQGIIADLEATVQAQQEQIQAMNDRHLSSDAQAIQESAENERDKLEPLTLAGQSVRNARLERLAGQKPGIMALGARAIEGGNAVADAIFYSAECPVQRYDPELFAAIYGTSPHFVLRNRGSTALVDMLNWRADMWSWYNEGKLTGSFESSEFGKTFNKIVESSASWSPALWQEYLHSKDCQGKHLYGKLRALWSMAKKAQMGSKSNNRLSQLFHKN